MIITRTDHACFMLNKITFHFPVIYSSFSHFTKFNTNQVQTTSEDKFDIKLLCYRFTDSSLPESQNEELNNWSQGLLSIGTLGNQDIKEEIETEEKQFDRDSRISRDYSQGSQEYSRSSQEYSRASQDLPDFTIEEVKKLQEALTKLLKRKPKSGEEEKANLPLDRFLNCPSSLEVERTRKKESNNESDENEIGDLSPNTKMILCKARDLLVNNKKTMKQKSIKFLLKKLFVCGGGFMPKPDPILRDPTPDSRMDKVH